MGGKMSKLDSTMAVEVTDHALERAGELGLKVDKEGLINIFLNALPAQRNVRRELYKLEKYKDSQLDINYYETKKMRFTVKEYPDRQLILTVTPRSKRAQRVHHIHLLNGEILEIKK